MSRRRKGAGLLQVGAAMLGAIAIGALVKQRLSRKRTATAGDFRTGIQSTSWWDPRFYDYPEDVTLLKDEHGFGGWG